MILSKEQSTRANDILGRAFAMFKVKDVYSRRWPDYEKAWRMVEEGRTGEDAWRADLPQTWDFATIKTAQSAFVDSKVIPIIIRHEDDPESKAADLRDLYTDIAEKGNLDSELYFVRLDAFKLGNGFTKTIYRKDTRMIWDLEKFDPKENNYTWKKKEINDFDDPCTQRVSPYLVLKDDLARADWNTVRDLIEVEVMGRDAAEEKYGHLINFDDVPQTTQLLSQLIAPASVNVAETDGTGLRGTEFENISKYHFFAPGFEWSNDVVEILHYWNRSFKVPSGANESYEILINGYPVQVDMKATPSPLPYIHKQIPYTHYMYSPYSGDEAWAAGIIEIGRPDAKAIQKNREKMDDRQSISLFSPAFSDVNDELDQRVMKLKPLTIIRTKGGVPRQFNIPGITNSDLAMLDRHESSYKRATGIDERILGVQGDNPRLTATEVSFLREAALKRLREFAFLYKNALLHSEIHLKLSLFKQYFSNPLVTESKKKNDKADRILKNKFKEFKIKTGNVYTKKEISPNYFEGEVDVDLDLQLLMPMTQSQLVTMWSQLIRDTLPAIQAGIVDFSIKKMYDGYVEALGKNPESLREDRKALSIEMAEAEHRLFADPNTSASTSETLPQGTDKKFLGAEHLLKHEELLDADVQIEDREKKRLLEHIQKDIANWKTMQTEQAQPVQPLNPQAFAGVGGLQAGMPATMPAAPAIPTPSA